MTQLHRKPSVNPLLWAQDLRDVFLEQMRHGYDHASIDKSIDLYAQLFIDGAFREQLSNPALKGPL